MITRRLIVRGRVQGVSYRAWTVRTARALGLDGWVRNRTEGAVEIVAQGSDKAVEELIRRCRQGPPAASVDDLRVEETDREPLRGFSTRPTA